MKFFRLTTGLCASLLVLATAFGQSPSRAAAIVSVPVQGTTITDNGPLTYTTFPALLGAGVTIASIVGDAPIVAGGTENTGGTIITTLSGQTNLANLTQYTPSGTIGWNPYAPGGGAVGDTNNGADWLSIGGASGNASVTFDFSSPTDALSFVWGSASVGNQVTLYGQNGVISTITSDGNEDLFINGVEVLNGISNLINSYVTGPTITISSLQGITSAVFSTTQGGGFEVGGIQAAKVPEPSSIALLSAGLLALVLTRRRKKVGVASRS